MDHEPLLRVHGVTKKFGGLLALNDVSLTVRRGEILGLIGPNGAGKTTFVNCATGLDKPSGGRVMFKGQEITHWSAYRIGRAGMARTFQVVKPFKRLSVRDNVAVGAMFGGRADRRSTAEAKKYAEQVLERVGLQHRLHHRAWDLTVADLKRLELGKALAMDPELLFLDEVMAGLTPVEVQRTMELIREINGAGVTVVAIEHVMQAIMGISNRVVVLDFGKKVAEGSAQTIVQSPEVIQAYLGERFARRRQDPLDLKGSSVGVIEASPTVENAAAVVAVSPIPQEETASQELHTGAPCVPLLQITGLQSGYGDVQVLWDVALSIMAGEIIALVGANGAGKTTLLRTISQLIRPRGGRILFQGHNCTSAGAEEMVAAGVVQVPEGRRLFAGLTVRDNLLQGAYPRRDRRAVKDDLEWVIELLPRLGERLNQVAGHLSGGEQQMCAIARGLMARPKLLLIDELSFGLAPKVVDDLLEVITQINRQGTTLLVVEQDVQVALENAHRGYVLENGRIVKSGAASALLEDPTIRQAYLGI